MFLWLLARLHCSAVCEVLVCGIHFVSCGHFPLFRPWIVLISVLYYFDKYPFSLSTLVKIN